jgi:hypothetical protein
MTLTAAFEAASEALAFADNSEAAVSFFITFSYFS